MALNSVIKFSAKLDTPIVLTALAIGSITSSEISQTTNTVFPYPAVLRYLNGAQQILMSIFIIPLWKYYRKYFNSSTNILKTNTEYNVLLWFLYYSIIGATLLSISGTINNEAMKPHTITIPSNYAISGMKPLPVLILSIVFLKQKLNTFIFISIICTLIGIGCFVLELSSSNHNYHNNETYDTYRGILLTITCTCLFACYDIIIKKTSMYCYDKNKVIIGSILFLTCQNIIASILFCWTLYSIELDITLNTINSIKWVIMNGCMRFYGHIFAYLLISLKSPFYLSIASVLGIPLSFVVDVCVHNYKFNVYAICGAVFIIVSFLILDINKCTICCNKKKQEIKENNSTDTVNGLLINVGHSNIDYGSTVSISRVK